MQSFAELFQQDAVDTYWSDAKRPLACLMFLFPLLVVYEVGVLWIGGDQHQLLRNGADYWMRGGLQSLGADVSFLLPLLICTGLLGWHGIRKYPWSVSRETFYGMFGESLLFAFALVIVGQLHDLAFQRWTEVPQLNQVVAAADANIQAPRSVVLAVCFVGAGVYEEVMFRLCLLPAMFGAFRLTGMANGWAAFLAVFITSLCFSSAHYIGAAADQFPLFSFTFRAVAGLFFATLYLLRGFGITVGCHAFYDLLVGVVMQPEISSTAS